MTFPTAMMESIFIIMATDTKEQQDVAIIVLQISFLHAKNDEKMMMFIKGKMAELMVHMAPQIYRKVKV